MLLTGATGFVGSAVARRLLADGRELLAFVRRPEASPGFDVDRVRLLHGDVTDEPAVDAAVAELSSAARWRGVPAAVVHAAALISYRRADAEAARRVNVRGTRHVVEACVRHGVKRLVHVSSVVAVGHAPDAASSLDEDAPFNGAGLRSHYVTTKRAAEDYALAAAPELEVVVVNPGAVYGPSHRPTNSGRFVDAVEEGRLGPLAPPGSLSVVGVGDVARGIELALERGTDRRRYLLTESNWTLRELMAACERALGRPARTRVRVPRPLWRALVGAVAAWDRVRPSSLVTAQSLALLGVHFRFDARRARTELGWEPRPFEEVLGEMVALRGRGRPPE